MRMLLGGCGHKRMTVWTHTQDQNHTHKKKDLAIHLPQLMSSGSTPAVLTHLGVVRLWH